MRISRVLAEFDRPAISERNSFWRIRTTQQRFRHGARVFDVECLNGKVEAVCFTEGACAWAMMPPDVSGRELLASGVEQSGDDTLSFEPVAVADVPDRELLSLLICSLARSPFETAPCSNLGGRLLVSSDRTYGSDDRPKAVHAVEVGVSKDMCLTLKVRTFTSLAKRRELALRGKAPLDSLPRYELAVNRFLRRTFDRGEDASRYVERATGNRRHRVAFLDVSSEEAFRKCKVGILADVLHRLGVRYGEAVSLTFQDVEELARIDCRSAKKPEWHSRVAAALPYAELVVVDATGENGALARQLAVKASELFGIPARVADAPDPHASNLRVIHDDEYYGDSEDPHDEAFGTLAVQHIEVETAAGGVMADAVVEGAVKELAIKGDVLRRRMTLLNWEDLGLGSPWSFGVRVMGQEGESRYALLEVGADGACAYSLEGEGWFGEGEHAPLVGALSLNKDAASVIQGPKGDINAVMAAELYTLPDTEGLFATFKGQGHVSRSKEARDRYFADVTDIAYAQDGKGGGYYRVGVVGYGMPGTVTNASLLRQVKPLNGSRSLFPDALRLMDVDFVRMRQLSITPFPLKYLNEWVRMGCPEAGLEESGRG